MYGRKKGLGLWQLSPTSPCCKLQSSKFLKRHHCHQAYRFESLISGAYRVQSVKPELRKARIMTCFSDDARSICSEPVLEVRNACAVSMGHWDSDQSRM